MHDIFHQWVSQPQCLKGKRKRVLAGEADWGAGGKLGNWWKEVGPNEEIVLEH